MAEDEERREGEDRDVVVLIVDYDDAEHLVTDYTQNLSSGGVFIHTQRDLAVGDEVRLMLSFPSLLEPVAIAGCVRWAQKTEVDCGVGIEFTNFDGDARDRLHNILQRIRENDPKLVSRVMRLLIVEDNPHVARLIRDGLGAGRDLDVEFSFSSASDGREALDLLLSEHFDILVTDIYLPTIDGSTIIARVREEERYKELPIIAVSAGGKSARDSAMAAGANFFIEKPMRLRQIIDTIKKLINA